MPAKKEAVVLQREINNQEQWDEIMATEALYVVDVYQRWCGPCAAVVNLFKRLKNEIGDDLLKFAIAEADSIETLERYRGHCEPCFLFFGSGHLVDVIRGANGPGIQKSVTTQLAAEHRVLEQGAERKVIKDPLLAALEAKEQAVEQAEAAEKRKLEEEAQIGEIICGEEKCEDVSVRPVSENTIQQMFSGIQEGESRDRKEPVPKEVTVILIKPDAVKQGKVDEIVQKLVDNGLDVLAQEEKTLTEDEAREFYKEHEEEDHFESLVQFMSSGPSHILVLTKGDTGEGVVHEVRALIGPKDVDVAREEAPDSLRALYGTDKTMNALHGADSSERAARELSFFFPNLAVPIVPGTGPRPQVQKTLALIRPDALKEHKDAILEKIRASGFEVCLQKEIQLTEEQSKEFYKQQEGQPHFDELISHMTSGPVLALGLARDEAIQNWRNLLGPKEVDVAKQEAPDSLRAQFTATDISINCLHGSDSVEAAKKELNYFFPTEHTLAVIKPDASSEHKDAIIEKIHEAGFNIACQKSVHLDRELAEQLYKEHEGKEFFDGLLDHMTSGPSMIMVLSREDAIQGWRTVMGPTDPEQAKEQAPESLRALLGKDVLNNAIHGSSDKDHALEKIQTFFPEVKLESDGSLTDDGQNSGSVADPTTQDQQELVKTAEDQQEGDAPADEQDSQQENQGAPDGEGGVEQLEGAGEEDAIAGGEDDTPGGGEQDASVGGEEDTPGVGEGEQVTEDGEGDEKHSVEESKDEERADGTANQAEGVEGEAQPPADAASADGAEPTTDEGAEPPTQEEPSQEAAPENAEPEKGEQQEQPPAIGEEEKAIDGDQERVVEDTPAAQDTPLIAEEQQTAEKKPSENDQTAEPELSQDMPSEEPTSQQETAPTEQEEQPPEGDEQAPQGGDEQKEEPVEGQEAEQNEKPVAEGGDDKVDIPKEG